ncbi:MAG: signal peptidase I [Candidatus Hermodarchaeia archaeon]
MSPEKSWKREFVEDAIVIAVVLMVIWGTGIGLQFYLQTPTPLLAVESGSMEPVFYRGDLVIVRAVDPTTLVVGDIVIYNASSLNGASGDVPIVHRIIEIQDVGGELRFITRGDNNPWPDRYYRTEDDILAKVIGSVKYLGFVTLILLPPTGLTSIIILIVTFLVRMKNPKLSTRLCRDSQILFNRLSERL